MTRVLFVDDHPALRAGLLTVLRREPGIVVVGAATDASEAIREVELNWPDVVLVDYQLPDVDGLALCQQLKALPQPPAVLVYSGYADASLSLAGTVAGADGLISKAAPADELIDALRTVGRGGSAASPPSPDMMLEAARVLDERDLPILGMIVSGTPEDEIAEVLGLSEAELAGRRAAIVDRLKLQVSA